MLQCLPCMLAALMPVLLVIVLVLHGSIQLVAASTHWKVTDQGRVELREDSPFTLLRPYDLAAFRKQERRLDRLELLRELIAAKDMMGKRDSSPRMSVASYQENFYKSDPDCLRAGQQLTKFAFYETHYISWHAKGFTLAKETSRLKKSQVKTFKKPYCTNVPLPFSMKTLNHLDSVQMRANITMNPEYDMLPNLLIEPEDFYGHLVHKSMTTNTTSWIYMTMAADYFRIKGDYTNTIECYQRAIFYAPNNFQVTPLLSMANMLHKLHFINDSLSIALACASLDPSDVYIPYFLGNIYVTLGELSAALAWYERSSTVEAQLKKYATACHIKLEEYLEEQHENLQKKLDDLKDYQSYSDEWFHLSSQIELERSSPSRKAHTSQVYSEFRSVWTSSICDWDKSNKSEVRCQQLPLPRRSTDGEQEDKWRYSAGADSGDYSDANADERCAGVRRRDGRNNQNALHDKQTQEAEPASATEAPATAAAENSRDESKQLLQEEEQSSASSKDQTTKTPKATTTSSPYIDLNRILSEKSIRKRIDPTYNAANAD